MEAIDQERIPTLWVGGTVDPMNPSTDVKDVEPMDVRYKPCVKDVIVISFMLSLWLYSIWLMFR